jgi:FKBP-type peptidyl-prolyl cis-trans isomerase
MNRNLVYAIIAGVVFLLIFSYFSLGLNQNNDDTKEDQTASQVELPEGVEIDDTKEGSGSAVAATDTVVVHYDAYLEEPAGSGEKGTKFDSSRDAGSPFEATLGTGSVIEGFDKGLVGLKVGGTRTIFIPSAYAYGEAGSGPIPPNSNLIFEVELLEIK